MPIDRQSVPLLAVEDLGVEFRTRGGTVRALEGVGFELHRGETMALVGESGSGKSVTAYAMMGILDGAARVTAGTHRVRRARPAASGRRDDLSEIRGRELAIIFQNPRTALNPIRPVGRQIADILLQPRQRHRRAGAGARDRDAGEGAHPRSGAARRRLSVRALGRHVPARHDRDGARLRAGAADRRRADHRARRHDAGGDHGPDRRTRRRKTTWPPC